MSPRRSKRKKLDKDIELINFFIKIIQKYISENIYRRKKKRIPYRKTIDLLEKLFFPSKNMCLNSVKINTQDSQYIETVVNRHKNKRIKIIEKYISESPPFFSTLIF